jgi:hypothetical protein
MGLTGKLSCGCHRPHRRASRRGRIDRDRGALWASSPKPDAEGRLLADAKGLLFRATGEQARLIATAARAMRGADQPS